MLLAARSSRRQLSPTQTRYQPPIVGIVVVERGIRSWLVRAQDYKLFALAVRGGSGMAAAVLATTAAAAETTTDQYFLYCSYIFFFDTM